MQGNPNPALAGFTDNELLDEIATRQVADSIKRIRSANIGGYTARNVLVKGIHPHDDEEIQYMFFIVNGDQELDFYYGHPHDLKDELIETFVPQNFAEASENMYEIADQMSQEGAKALFEQLGYQYKEYAIGEEID